MVRRGDATPAAHRSRVTRPPRALSTWIVATAGSIPPPHRGLRIAIFALLFCNTAYYLFAGTLSKFLDAAAWLVLLALFALETGLAGGIRTRAAAIAVRGTRLAAAAAICAAGIIYVVAKDWLDALNTGLWIAIVVTLEFEVRRPLAVARRRLLFVATATLLYAGLATLVFAWAWRGEWFDAYDALLWLMAFALIEMDLLRAAGPGSAA